MAKPSTLPEWASDTNFSSGTKSGTVTKLEPALAYKKQGWVPSLQWFGQYANWLLNLVYQWCAYLDNLHGEADFLNKAYAWVGSHSFTPATATAAGLTSTGNTSGAGIVATGGTSGRGATFAAGGGNNYGAHCTGSGTFSGVHGVGGATGAGVTGTGGASGGIGVFGQGTTNSAGVSGIGNGTAMGVYGQGGNTDGIGVYGLGQGAGAGGYFQGGASNGKGIVVIGDGSALGIEVDADTNYAIEATSTASAINAVSTGSGGGNYGVLGSGYTGNGNGVVGQGQGTGAGGRFRAPTDGAGPAITLVTDTTGAVGPHIRMNDLGSATVSVSDGDIWFSNGELQIRSGGVTYSFTSSGLTYA
jgi:hypothetical protein